MILYNDLIIKKHLGNKVIALNNGEIIGYEVISYEKYIPYELKEVNRISNNINKVISWDTAYDMLFNDITVPDFNKVIN